MIESSLIHSITHKNNLNIYLGPDISNLISLMK